MVDDDGDILVNTSKTIVCDGDTSTNVKFGVEFEGPLNCKDSAVPTGAGSSPRSTDVIRSTGSGHPSTPILFKDILIKCKAG